MPNAIDRYFFEKEEQRLLIDIERAAANLRYATERHREFREHREAERVKEQQ